MSVCVCFFLVYKFKMIHIYTDTLMKQLRTSAQGFMIVPSSRRPHIVLHLMWIVHYRASNVVLRFVFDSLKKSQMVK